MCYVRESVAISLCFIVKQTRLSINWGGLGLGQSDQREGNNLAGGRKWAQLPPIKRSINSTENVP